MAAGDNRTTAAAGPYTAHTALEHFTIDLNGPVHGIDYGGEGRLVLLVHGLGGSGINWMEVGAEMTRYGRVIAPDLPGFGRSPLAGRSSSIHAQAKFLAEFIEARTDRPAVIVGNSMGALAAMLLAGARPELVDRLVLLDPPAPSWDIRSLHPVWIMTLLLYMTPGLNRVLIAWVYRNGVPERRIDDALALLTGSGSISPAARRLHLDSANERCQMPWLPKSQFTAFRSVFGLMTPPRKYDRMVMKIKAPTLLIHGTADSVVPFKATELVARIRPDWTFTPITGAGHVAMLETPRLFLDLAAEFLAPATAGTIVVSTSTRPRVRRSSSGGL